MIRVTRFRTGKESDKYTDKLLGVSDKSISSYGYSNYDGLKGYCGTFKVTLKDNDKEHVQLHITITEDEIMQMAENIKLFKLEQESDAKRYK